MLITVITFCNLLNPTPPQAEKYRRRISGPQLDQIDVHVEVPLVDYRDPASMKESV
ncbi:MAG: ATP-binding protein [Akkermansiaceae bacterium]